MALSSPVIGTIKEFQVPIFLFVGVLILLTVLIEKYGDKLETTSSQPGHLDYEKESLKEIFDASTKKAVLDRGRNVGTTYYEGKFEQGYVHKELTRTEADEPIEISVKRGKDGETTEETKQLRVWLIGEKSSRTARYTSKVSNALRSAIGKEDSRNVQVISEDLIKHESDEKIVLENGVDWNYDPDVEAWFSVGTAENNVKKRTIVDKTLNKLLEEFPNYTEKANRVNPAQNFRREIEEAKKRDSDDPGV